MKTKETKMRSYVMGLFDESNKDAIEALVSCMVCLMLVNVLGIVNSLDTVIYLLVRTYAAVLVTSMGIRYTGGLKNNTTEKFIMYFLVFAFIAESAYVIIDEFVFMFRGWLR